MAIQQTTNNKQSPKIYPESRICSPDMGTLPCAHCGIEVVESPPNVAVAEVPDPRSNLVELKDFPSKEWTTRERIYKIYIDKCLKRTLAQPE